MWGVTMEEGLLFRRAGGGLVKVAPAALAQLLLFRQLDADSTEAGGVLLGRHIVGCRDIVIDEVTAPVQEDRRLRLAFHRSQASHQKVIDARWLNSGGTCHYLGEWHTHPQTAPTPSLVDLADWRRRLRVDQFEGDSLLFLIVGTRELCAWEGMRPPASAHGPPPGIVCLALTR
jgi:integrative and conjugative element protein (TIGR02256 family)